MESPKVRSKELREKIEDTGITYIHLANNLGIQSRTLRMKVDGEVYFKPSEIVKLSAILQLTPEERDYLFCLEIG